MNELKVKTIVELRQLANKIESMSDEDFVRYANTSETIKNQMYEISEEGYLDTSLSIMNSCLGEEEAAVSFLFSIDNREEDKLGKEGKYIL
jgi:hypothetical protein